MAADTARLLSELADSVGVDTPARVRTTPPPEGPTQPYSRLLRLLDGARSR